MRPQEKTVKKPGQSSKKTRILIVDDHPITRSGLAYLINHQPDMIVCCEAQNAAQALEGVIRNKPDLVLTDFTLPDKNGLELIKDIKAIDRNFPYWSSPCTRSRSTPNACCVLARAAISQRKKAVND